MEAPKILVVDDESRMRKLVKDFLEKKNFHVLEAGDGEEGEGHVGAGTKNGAPLRSGVDPKWLELLILRLVRARAGANQRSTRITNRIKCDGPAGSI